MKRAVVIIGLLAAAVWAAVAYQAAARERDYRMALTNGDAALAGDQTFGAIEAYSGAIALRPDSMLPHLRRGETYQRRGDLEAAAHDFQMASDLDPSATRPLEELGDVRYKQQRFKRAAEIYESRLRLDDRSPAVAYKLAVARYRDGNLDGAIAAIEQASEPSDRPPDAFYLLGLCLREKQRLPEAIAAFEKAIAFSPGLIPAREELADIYASLGRRGDQLEQLQLIASLDHEHVERQVAIGLAHARAGHIELAVETLRNALERAPDQSPIYGAIGQAWLDSALARNDPADLRKALEALERVVSVPGATSEIMTLYGRALLQDNQPEAAESALRQATERYPVQPSAFLEYAAVAERHDHFDAARRALIDYGTLTDDERDIPARASRIAAMSLHLNEPATAVLWLQRAAIGNPGDLQLLAALADAQLKAGDRAGAQITIAKGLEKDPNNPALLSLSARTR